MNNLKSGYRGTCKPCRKLEAKIYYQKTKDKQIKRRKKHYENNKEKHKQTVYKYRKKHKKRLQNKILSKWHTENDEEEEQNE